MDRRRRRGRWCPGAALALALAGPAAGRELWSEGDRGLDLRTILKGDVAPSLAPDDPALYPEQATATSLWRLRLEAEGRLFPEATALVAYEQRLHVVSQGAGLAGLEGPIPGEVPGPYRLRQLDWAIAQRPGFVWVHEIDRADVALHLPRAEITLGRQAVGWGRGVLFGAVDLFAPFTPLEADREWRRGVDAVRADVRISDRFSVDGVAAFGESIDTSAFAARLRGYAGKADGELVLGWRARDLVAGVTSSAAVGDAEVHGELCLFLAPEPLANGGAWGNDRLAPKAVLGGSYRFAVGQGLVVFAEYHYSGFGARQAGDVIALLADPAYRARLLRGDTQILGRHALALLANLEVSGELAAQALWIQSPDGSGVASPGALLTLSDAVSVQANLYLPYGARPVGPRLGSDFGGTPLAAFVQVRVYD